MKVTKDSADATHRLVDLTVQEVSLVTAAANKREFLVIKADMRGKHLKGKSSVSEIALIVAELAKLNVTTPEGLKSLREKTAALTDLLTDDESVTSPPVNAIAEKEDAEPSADATGAVDAKLSALLVTKQANANAAVGTLAQVAASLDALTQIVKSAGILGNTGNSNVVKDEKVTSTDTKDPWSEFDRKVVE